MTKSVLSLVVVLFVIGVSYGYPLPYCGADLTVPKPPDVVLEQAQLVAVKVLARHGDRIADTILPPAMEVAWNCDAANRLMGISAPTTNYRIREVTDMGLILGSCSLGQLTDRGIEMHRTMGKNLREKYGPLLMLTENELCSNPAEVIYVRSTNIPRTIQSAQSNVNAFLQNCTTSELVDIWLSTSIDEFLTPTLSFVCPAINKNNFFY